MAFVQSWTNEANSPAASLDTTISGATADNLLVAVVAMRSGVTPTGTAATGWTIQQEATGSSHSGFVLDRIATGDTSDDLNLSWSGNQLVSVTIAEYSGAAASSPLEDSAEDDTNIATDVTSQGTGSATPVTANGVAIACLTFRGQWDNSGDVVSIDNSFTIDASEAGAGTRPGSYIASKAYTSTAAQSATWSTDDATGEDAYGAMLVYKDAAAAGGKLSGSLGLLGVGF